VTAETCGATKQTLRHTWVCTRPPHSHQQKAVDNYRRRQGKIPNADRHVYVAARGA
jgi:hypothetical protein